MNSNGRQKNKKGRTINRRDQQKTNGKIVDLNLVIIIIILNGNTLNITLQRQRLSDLIF